MPPVDHDKQKRLNNRAENSPATRERERRMRGFKSAGHAQRFLSTFGVIASSSRPGRHLLAAQNYREIMHRRFAQWRELAGLQPAILINNPVLTVSSSPPRRLFSHVSTASWPCVLCCSP